MWYRLFLLWRLSEEGNGNLLNCRRLLCTQIGNWSSGGKQNVLPAIFRISISPNRQRRGKFGARLLELDVFWIVLFRVKEFNSGLKTKTIRSVEYQISYKFNALHIFKKSISLKMILIAIFYDSISE